MQDGLRQTLWKGHSTPKVVATCGLRTAALDWNILESKHSLFWGGTWWPRKASSHLLNGSEKYHVHYNGGFWGKWLPFLLLHYNFPIVWQQSSSGDIHTAVSMKPVCPCLVRAQPVEICTSRRLAGHSSVLLDGNGAGTDGAHRCQISEVGIRIFEN